MTAPNTLYQQLAQLAYFQHLGAEDLARVADATVLRSFAPHETIFFEGDRANGLWLIKKGRVKIFKLNPDGTEHILHILGTHDSFNDIATFDGGMNPAEAAALSSAEIWLLPADIMLDLIQHNSAFAITVVRILAQRVRSLVGQIENLALYSVIVRLSRFLIDQLDNPSLSGPGVTRTAIVAHLATTPQTISNALRELETTGAIEFDRHRIWIIDENRLRAVAMLA